MKKKIGIIFPPSSAGGVFQYSLSVLQNLLQYSKDFEYSVIAEKSFWENYDEFPDFVEKIIIQTKPISVINKIVHTAGMFLGKQALLRGTIDRTATNKNIDLFPACVKLKRW